MNDLNYENYLYLNDDDDCNCPIDYLLDCSNLNYFHFDYDAARIVDDDGVDDDLYVRLNYLNSMVMYLNTIYFFCFS